MKNKIEKILLNSIPVYRRELDDNVTQYILFENDICGNVIHIHSSTLGEELDTVYKYIQEFTNGDLKNIKTQYIIGVDPYNHD